MATYNIHEFVGTDGLRSEARIRKVLLQLQADVIALQEVSDHSDSMASIGAFADLIDFEIVFGRTMKKGIHHFGNALLTRLPIVQQRTVDLSHSGGEPRGAIEALLDWQGIGLRVVTTHLALKRQRRRRQIGRLLQLLDEPSDSPVQILLGDMNEWNPFRSPLREIEKRFGDSSRKRTFPSRYPLLPLDRIWIRPEGLLQEISTVRTRDSRLASDHLPLRAVISSPGVRGS